MILLVKVVYLCCYKRVSKHYKKMKNTLTTIVLLLFTFTLIACECPEYDLKTLDKVSYEMSDVVIIGVVVKTGTNFKIVVVELLKGTIKSDTLDGTVYESDDAINSCSFFPRDKGKYLFYLNRVILKGKTYYQYSECLGTRMLNMAVYPVSLHTEKTKKELIIDTNLWIDEMRRKK